MVNYDSFEELLNKQSEWSGDVFAAANEAFCHVHKGNEDELNEQFMDLADMLGEFVKKRRVHPTALCFFFGRIIESMIQMHADDMIDGGIVYDREEEGAIVIGTYVNTVLYGVGLSLKAVDKGMIHD